MTNILEALDCVSRKSKNVYKWHGTTHMAQTIKKLRVRERALDAALVSCRPRVPETFAQHVHAPVRWFGSRACPSPQPAAPARGAGPLPCQPFAR